MNAVPDSGRRAPGLVLRLVLSALLLLGLTVAPACTPTIAPAGPALRDFTFFVCSDVHVGAEQPKANPPVTREQVLQKVRDNLDRLGALPGTAFPRTGAFATLHLGPIATPRGLFILGDLVDGHKDTAEATRQWTTFESIFSRNGVRLGAAQVTVFALAGNHDGEPTGPARRGLIERNRALHAAGRLAAVSDNGAHFAVNWDGVHLIGVNLCPADGADAETPFRFGKPGPGSWNDPQQALAFVGQYLRQHVGRSGEPVILMQHYGFDGFSMGDWNWWTPRQRRALYDLLADYHVAAILHGHNHHAEHYRWPDPKRHAADLAAMFGGTPPHAPRQYTIVSCGGVGWVFRIRGDELVAAHLRGPGWSDDPVSFVVKSLRPARRE